MSDKLSYSLLLASIIFPFSYGLTHYEYMGLDKSCSFSDIKREYRKLVLVYHPDKISVNVTETEKESMKNLFIKIQLAYETLSDDAKRKAYDLALESGLLDEDASDGGIGSYYSDKYKKGPFSLYAKRGKRISSVFNAYFDIPSPPPVEIPIYLPLKTVFTGYSSTSSFKRLRVCPQCYGLGSKSRFCNICTLCQGRGQAMHIPKVNEGVLEFDQMVGSICENCGGSGCSNSRESIPADDICTLCNGNGIMREDVTVPYSIPINYENGVKIIFEGLGHQDVLFTYGVVNNFMLGNSGFKRAVSDVTITIRYQIPDGMHLINDESKDVVIDMRVPVSELIESGIRKNYNNETISTEGNKFSRWITEPYGETVEITLSDYVSPYLNVTEDEAVADNSTDASISNNSYATEEYGGFGSEVKYGITLEDAVYGIKLTKKGLGMIRSYLQRSDDDWVLSGGDRYEYERGDLIVNVKSDWTDMKKSEWLALLASSGFNENDKSIRKLTQYMFPEVTTNTKSTGSMYIIDPKFVSIS